MESKLDSCPGMSALSNLIVQKQKKGIRQRSSSTNTLSVPILSTFYPHAAFWHVQFSGQHYDTTPLNKNKETLNHMPKGKEIFPAALYVAMHITATENEGEVHTQSLKTMSCSKHVWCSADRSLREEIGVIQVALV